MRKIFYGIAAGLLSALVCVVLAYVVGVVVIGVDTREFLPTLLAATTVLALMLLFLLLIPTLAIGLLVGIAIGITAKVSSRVYIIGATAGVLSSLLALSVVLPRFIAHAPDDFIAIISQPLRTTIYGLTLGLIAAFIFQKLNATTK